MQRGKSIRQKDRRIYGDDLGHPCGACIEKIRAVLSVMFETEAGRRKLKTNQA
ncbi:MAG: hypothetical protein KKF00_12485 [Proteobacteria bacterium]|nr:hypothetical protein [Pseudomonadota bacterium]